MKDLKWIEWAKELQSIAQCALTYCKDSFDRERFERVREISAEIMSHQGDLPFDDVWKLFCGETGYATPKIDSRAAIIKDGKILLVCEHDGRWSMPGGWVDFNQTVRSNIIKESWEEAGLDVVPGKLVALQDRNQHNNPPYAYNVCKVFMLCETVGGEFHKNIETSASGWFEMCNLPQLALEKCTEAQIELCFRAYEDPNWQPQVD